MKIGLLTGGGDCAGLNAALKAAAQCLLNHGVEALVGIEDGFLGLIEQRTRPLTHDDVDPIIATGGTVLGSCNKASPLQYRDHNVAPQVQDFYQTLGLDGIIAFGGDGTMSLCHALESYDMQFVGVPKTIDNDIAGNEQSFGFDSAVAVAVEAIDRLHTTARSHHRTMIIETMGRYAGWIALYAGVAGDANVILLPEFPYSPERVAEVVNTRFARHRYTIIVIAEGAKMVGDGASVSKTVKGSPDPIRLGGAGLRLQAAIEPLVDCEVRTTQLGHVQRGGSPTATDRLLATHFGYHAAQLALQNQWGQMVCLQSGAFSQTPLSRVADRVRKVTMSNPVFQSALGCGITFANTPLKI